MELLVEVFDEDDAGVVLTYRAEHAPRAGDELYLEGFGAFRIASTSWTLEESGGSHRPRTLLACGYFLDDEREEESDG